MVDSTKQRKHCSEWLLILSRDSRLISFSRFCLSCHIIIQSLWILFVSLSSISDWLSSNFWFLSHSARIMNIEMIISTGRHLNSSHLFCWVTFLTCLRRPSGGDEFCRCLPTDLQVPSFNPLFCNPQRPSNHSFAMECCRDRDYCNENLNPKLTPLPRGKAAPALPHTSVSLSLN